MGQEQSTLLTLLRDHFKDVGVRAQNLRLEVKKGKFFTFCRNEWPTFQVGCPEGGTFDLQTIYQVKNVVFGKPGHPDLVPYIVTGKT